MDLNYGNFENETFEKLSGVILCSNFTNCVFADPSDNLTFEKCNLKSCKLNKPCKFIKSSVINTHIQEPNEELVMANASTLAKTNGGASYIDDKTTDEALEKSIYEKSSYAFRDNVKEKTIDKNAPYFENPFDSRGYVLVGETGICRGDFKDGKFPDIDLNYANCIVETNMHPGIINTRAYPYVKTIFEYIRHEGMNKNIKIDLSKISHPKAVEALQNAGIELREYYFTISGISFRGDDERVMIVDLSNPNETVHFQYMFDMRQFGGIALRFNTPIKGIEKEKSEAQEEIIRGIKENEVVIANFVDINVEENKI